MKLILASTSPRRAEILRNAGFVFDVLPTHTDETRQPDEAAEDYVRRIAQAKAHAAREQLRATGEPAIVIAADTVVLAEGQILTKPQDAADARRMLRMMSGKSHEILTGLAILRLPDGVEAVHIERTCVELLPISDDQIESYLGTGESFDKAGAYGIQGVAGRFVAKIDGCYFNVMGLPLSRVWRAIRALGWEDHTAE
jgi:septum formation protein